MSEYVEYLERQLKEFHEATGCATAAGWLSGSLQAPVVVPPPWEPKVGDVVRLRSGSPDMTVLAVEPTVVTCWWPNSGDGQYSFDVKRNTITWDDTRLLELVR